MYRLFDVLTERLCVPLQTRVTRKRPAEESCPEKGLVSPAPEEAEGNDGSSAGRKRRQSALATAASTTEKSKQEASDDHVPSHPKKRKRDVSDRIIELLKPFLSWDLRLVDVDH
jgi:hypothetical protein